MKPATKAKRPLLEDMPKSMRFSDLGFGLLFVPSSNHIDSTNCDNSESDALSRVPFGTNQHPNSPSLLDSGLFGATGISGIAAIDALLQDSSYERIIGISRRPVDRQGVDHISIDLINSSDNQIADILIKGGADTSTHVFFYAYIDSQDIEEQNSVNNKLFDKSISAVSKACPNLKSFHLQTGYKYYMPGFTAEKFPPLPFKEDSKRQGHVPNFFYYHQEDKLAIVAEENGWNWTVSRPCAIAGYSKGNWMSVSVTAALYAFGCKEFGENLHYPGPLICYDMDYDNSTAKNNAEFQLYVVEHAQNRAFNINDGKPYQFNTLWPQIAAYFGLELPSPPAQDVEIKAGEFLKVVHSVTEWAERHKYDFPKLVQKYDLDPKTFEYANWSSIEIAAALPYPIVGDMDSARSIGWNKTFDPPITQTEMDEEHKTAVKFFNYDKGTLYELISNNKIKTTPIFVTSRGLENILPWLLKTERGEIRGGKVVHVLKY
ncbi:hypothetical protein E3Q13_04336 [Wallemia mellicola]|nr:hypothetical protein E3Q13_04336 [Wallemia mellicola]TIC30847.1 hypothetical protein E3Q09_04199 [Wallemia mellicola]TIC49738.1 hypothetical protein E3Q04_04266 [Wallemia mellicola]